MWFAETPSKRWAEKFFLYYSPVWITWALGIIVPFQLYKRFTAWEYLWVGLAAALPCVLVPPFMLCAADKGRPWHEQHWVKANVWIAIFSFVGNYFWTHYFYTLLGASYTFPSWRLNDVPFALYLLTHAYFCFYHIISNITLRRLRCFLNTPSSTPRSSSVKHPVNSKSTHSGKSKPSSSSSPSSSASSASRSSVFSLVVQGAWVLALAYITAFMETATIANVRHKTLSLSVFCAANACSPGFVTGTRFRTHQNVPGDLNLV
ncbi:unnamed protein product [Closterium sp. NIES-53]